MPGFETGCLLTMLVSTPHAASGSQGHRPCEVLRSIIRMPAFWLAVLTALCPALRAADFDGAKREDRHRPPENWLSYDRDNTGQRFSSLDQINRSNVRDLVVKWVHQFQPVPLRSEATPLVRDGVMYVTAGGTMAFALDATTGRALWRFDYPFEAEGGRRPPNWNRGFAISGNRLYMGTIDCHLLALDARTGSLLWKSLITEQQPCFGATAAPLVVRNRVLIGVRGGDSGRLRGFLDAFDAETGERAWRFYTIPSPGDPGSETWPDTDAWKAGGAAPWTTGTYDPELDLLYWPTGNPGPKDFDGRDREGDNLYSTSVIALRPDDGKLVWHYQFTPHDEHDWDANETPVLVDAEWKGRPRKLLVQANRNAFFYVLDRTDGAFLLAKPFAKQTWAEGISPDGRPILVEEASPSLAGSLACPDIHGGANWHAPSYNPRTGLFYVTARDGCGVYYRTGHSIDHDGAGARQFVRAIDIHDGATRWEIPFLGDEAQEINHAGTMTTAGGLVFFSSRVGNFAAADARTGELLWHFNTGGTIRASPMTYAYRGRQYVAITSKNGIFVFGLHRQEEGG
jgi:alcohol dehydrogenase (cytochrome c)